MSAYTGKPTTVNHPVGMIYEKISRLDTFADRLAEMPDDVSAKVGDVSFEKEAIIINTPQIGQLRLEIVERIENQRVVLEAVGSPVPAKIIIDLKAIDGSSTEITPSMDVEVPMMIRPFVGPKLQQAADQFGNLIENLAKA